MDIFRGMISHQVGDPSHLAGEISRLKADLVVLRLPAGEVSLPIELARRRLMLIHADTLVYYERNARLPARQLPGNPSDLIQEAVAADQPEIEELAKIVFRQYRSHYHAHPKLDPEAIAAGYAEWASSCISESLNGNGGQPHIDRKTWVVRNDRKIIAFATCMNDEVDGSVEILLNAVDPRHSGRGVYGSLLRHTVDFYRQCNLERIRISTQVWNYTVQRAWVREGFLLTQAYDTYHLHLDSHGIASE